MAPPAIDQDQRNIVAVIDHTLVEQGDYLVNAEMSRSIHYLCLWTVPPVNSESVGISYSGLEIKN